MLLRGLFIVIGAFFLGLAASPASAYSVHKCDEIAENDISVAADYIDRRLQGIADEFTHISKDIAMSSSENGLGSISIARTKGSTENRGAA